MHASGGPAGARLLSRLGNTPLARRHSADHADGSGAPTDRPAVTAPIIGPRTPEQLTDVLGVPEMQLGDDVLTRLDELFPGPGGTPPEAYAW